MATSTQTITLESALGGEGVETHELRRIRKPAGFTSTPVTDAERGGSYLGPASGSTLAAHERELNSTPEEPPQPWLKIFSVGFSFFCAGINDSTLGPLIPYLLVSFSIGTGMVAVLYACNFTGWIIGAFTNPALAPHLKLGQLLCLGAFLQLAAQVLRPFGWSGLPAFAVSFFLQSLGTAYQDALGNTFVSGVRVAHRWLGFIHAMYALALLVGPLLATAIASNATPGNGSGFVGGEESWKRTYFVTVGLGVVNVVWVAIAFRDTLVIPQRDNGVPRGGDEEGAGRAVGGEEDKQTALSALRDMGTMLKVRDVWLISLFFFFALGAAQTAGGKSTSPTGPPRYFRGSSQWYRPPLLSSRWLTEYARLGRQLPRRGERRRCRQSGLRAFRPGRRNATGPSPAPGANPSLWREADVAPVLCHQHRSSARVLAGAEHHSWCHRPKYHGLLPGPFLCDRKCQGFCSRWSTQYQ
ncbi:hypothetical protein SLS64_005172 [Diaporthe eres]